MPSEATVLSHRAAVRAARQMQLRELHLLLTYKCDRACEHCFVWGSPRQTGTMTLQTVRHILCQARDTGSIEWVYFEGGEPFLCYGLLLAAIREAKEMGFLVGVVSNGYWAKDEAQSVEQLAPFVGLVDDLSVSSDPYHSPSRPNRRPDLAVSAAQTLGIPTLTLSLDSGNGGKEDAVSDVMHRGRAAERLAGKRKLSVWSGFSECPHENLSEPSRVHVDAFGSLYVCQGIRIGNVFRTSLAGICACYRPEICPVLGPLSQGGPAELARRYGLPGEESYADACHLCYRMRSELRDRFPRVLGPDQMYGIAQDGPASRRRNKRDAKEAETGLSRSSQRDMVRRVLNKGRKSA